jgi:hypothetical protein
MGHEKWVCVEVEKHCVRSSFALPRAGMLREGATECYSLVLSLRASRVASIRSTCGW